MKNITSPSTPLAATDHFKIVEETGDRNLPETPSTALFKNGFNGQGIHLRSDFTENLTSHLSLTRSFNFLTINFKGVVSESHTLTPEGEWVLDEVDYAHYDVNVKVPVYTFREDISYKLTPTFQLEPGFLFSFSPANSFEDGRFPEYETSAEEVTRVLINEDGEGRRREDGC